MITFLQVTIRHASLTPTTSQGDTVTQGKKGHIPLHSLLKKLNFSVWRVRILYIVLRNEQYCTITKTTGCCHFFMFCRIKAQNIYYNDFKQLDARQNIFKMYFIMQHITEQAIRVCQQYRKSGLFCLANPFFSFKKNQFLQFSKLNIFELLNLVHAVL